YGPEAAQAWSATPVSTMAAARSVRFCRVMRFSSSIESVAELLPELVGELIVREALVLRAGMLDLERAHQRGDAADGRPVHAAHDREDEAGAVRIAAAG